MKATVVLFKSKTLTTGEHPLMLCLRDKAKIKYYALGVSLPKKHWNEKRRKWQALPPDIDELIKTTEAKYSAKIRELTATGKHVSLDTLYRMVEKPIQEDYTVLQWMERLRDDFRAVDKIGQANMYDNARRLLSLFLKAKDITFEEIDGAFLHRYEYFLRQRKIKDSTISIYMRTLRAAIAKAIEMGYAKDMPFTGFKIPKGQASKRALSIPEMEAILNLKRNDDYFRYLLFSYFTIGMNFTDMARLTWDNVRGHEIHYTRQKVHHKIIIPIHPKAAEVLDHYRPITGNMPAITGANDRYVFPILTKEVHTTEAMRENRTRKILKEFNKELKAIGSAAKVETPLTSYVLRHTAITNLVRAGVTADAIQALAGHKRLTTTENYIREASQEQKAKAVNML